MAFFSTETSTIREKKNHNHQPNGATERERENQKYYANTRKDVNQIFPMDFNKYCSNGMANNK